MLSIQIAYLIFIISLVGIIIILFISLESEGLPYGRKITKIDYIAYILKRILPFIFTITLIYSFISIFHYENTKHEQNIKTVTEQVKIKYDITLTEKQQTQLLENFTETYQNMKLYSSGSTTLDGEEIIAVWKNNELFLLEFKNGQFVEIQN